MESKGRLRQAKIELMPRKMVLTFEVDECSTSEANRLADCKDLRIIAKRWTDKRSNDANGLLWACLGELAAALRTDKWSLYLKLLREYGKYTYIVVRKEAVEAVKKQWRETEVVGEITMHSKSGKPMEMVQMLCYFGSSTYDTQEFSVLLDGLKYEMEQAGLEPPPSKDMRRALEELE